MVIEIDSLDRPELHPYAGIASGNKREESIIVVESPKVIERALDAGLRPLSLLCERKHLEGDAAFLLSRLGEMPVYTGSRDVLASLTGYTLTRGVLCAMMRPPSPPASELLNNASRLCVIYDVCDSTNIGVIFRTAAALGYDGVLLNPASCDPFNRRAVRVSMGAVFQIPWAFSADILPLLCKYSVRSVSMALSEESVFLQEFDVATDSRYAVILGSEGYGLPEHIIRASDHVVKIPMYHQVDSLNVGAAAAIALWHFRK